MSIAKPYKNTIVTNYLLKDFVISEICRSVTKLIKNKRKKFYGHFFRKGSRNSILVKTPGFLTRFRILI